MRKDEISLIMVKPKFGYDHDTYQPEIPINWRSDERVKALKTRRAFFEVHLIDWTVKHDILGDGSIIKTIV